MNVFFSSPYPDPQVYNPFRPRPQWTLSIDDEIVHSYPEFYEIRIFDADGKEIRRIIKDFDPVRVTSEMKEMAKKQAEKLGDTVRLEIPEYYPPIRDIVTSSFQIDFVFLGVITLSQLTITKGEHYETDNKNFCFFHFCIRLLIYT